MPWSDLSDVTGALVRLLKLNIGAMPGSNNGVDVVPTPPDRLATSVSNTLSLYLYHVRQSPAVRNIPGAADMTPPLTLELSYVLTAHHRTTKSFDALTEQRLIGYALKTFHDYPLLTEATRVNGQTLLTGKHGRDDPLKIEFSDFEHNGPTALQSTDAWPFPRLAVYYRVGPVLLDR